MLTGEASCRDDGRTNVGRATCRLGQGHGNGHHFINESEQDCAFVWSAAGRIPAAAIPTSTCCSRDATATSTRTDCLLSGLVLVLLDDPGLVLGLVDPFDDVRMGQHRLHVELGERRHGYRISDESA
jgi:hypothetical protein